MVLLKFSCDCPGKLGVTCASLLATNLFSYSIKSVKCLQGGEVHEQVVGIGGAVSVEQSAGLRVQVNCGVVDGCVAEPVSGLCVLGPDIASGELQRLDFRVDVPDEPTQNLFSLCESAVYNAVRW